MIEEESYWRADLKKASERLKNRYQQRRWSSRTLYQIEKEIFLSAYIIRKLMDSGKVARVVSGLNIRIKEYPILAGAEPSADTKALVATYDIYHGRDELLSVKKLCDQLVHSYIFSPLILSREHGVVFGIYFASDSESRKGVYYSPLVKIIEVIASAADNQRVKLRLDHNKDGTITLK